MFRLLRLSRCGNRLTPPIRVHSRQLQQSTAKRTTELRAWLLGGTVALIGGFYLTHLQVVPLTGRSRFILVDREAELAAAAQDSKVIASEYRAHLLPGVDDRVHQVVKVGRQVAKAAEAFSPQSHAYSTVNWRFNVIDSPEKNAVVLPGGQVFVFTGLLDELKTDQALAAVLSHEAAHMVLEHEAEKWSRKLVRSLPHRILWFLGYYPRALDMLSRPSSEVIVGLPNSSKLEAEANRLGVDIMAAASYDPKTYVVTLMKLDEQVRVAGSTVELLDSHSLGREDIHELIDHMVKHHKLPKQDEQDFLVEFSLTGP